LFRREHDRISQPPTPGKDVADDASTLRPTVKRGELIRVPAATRRAIQRHLNRKLREQKRNAAIAELIHPELLCEIKRWAKNNHCLPTDAIVRLIGIGLGASKAEKAAAWKPKRQARARPVPGLVMTSICCDAAVEDSRDGLLDVNACTVE
jgi:hypothetical protein